VGTEWAPLPDDDEELPMGIWTREEIAQTIREINAGFDALKRTGN
jgi:hypothetical protein